MKRFFILLAVLFSGCTASNEATRALEGAGYTHIQITGYSWFGCGEDDTFATGFEATGPSGKHVSGVVCSGLLKGATIRTE